MLDIWQRLPYQLQSSTLVHTHTHTCSTDPAIVGNTGERLLLESSGVPASHSIWCPPWLRNASPWGPFSEQGTAKSHSVWDLESMVVISRCKFCGGCAIQFGGNGVTSGRESGFSITITHWATHRLLCSNSSPRKAFLSSPIHRTLRISLRVTFGCSLLWKRA